MAGAKNDLTLQEKRERPERLARQHHVCCEKSVVKEKGQENGEWRERASTLRK